MRVVTPILKRVVYPALAGSGVFRRMSGKGLAVVTYHGVRPADYQKIDAALDGNLVDAIILQKQLRLLKLNYDLISPEDVLAWCEDRVKLPRKAVLLTCDDGLLNNLTDMLAVLRQEGAKCIFFVTGASAGENRDRLWYEDLFRIFLHAPQGAFDISAGGVTVAGNLQDTPQRRWFWWKTVHQLSHVEAAARNSLLQKMRQTFDLNDFEDGPFSAVERRFGLLVRTELLELMASGMTIGAHTLTHPILSLCPREIARQEIFESRNSLEKALQTRIWAMAYPFGDEHSVTPQILNLAEAAGYRAAFMNCGGGLGVELPRNALPRIHITSEMTLSELQAHVAGFYAALHWRAGRNNARQNAA